MAAASSCGGWPLHPLTPVPHYSTGRQPAPFHHFCHIHALRALAFYELLSPPLLDPGATSRMEACRAERFSVRPFEGLMVDAVRECFESPKTRKEAD